MKKAPGPASLPPRVIISCREGKNHDEPVVSGWHGSDAFPFIEWVEYLPKEEAEQRQREAVVKAWEDAAVEKIARPLQEANAALRGQLSDAKKLEGALKHDLAAAEEKLREAREALEQIHQQADMCDNPWASQYAGEALEKLGPGRPAGERA